MAKWLAIKMAIWQIVSMKANIEQRSTAALVYMSIDPRFKNQRLEILNEITNRISPERYEVLKNRAEINNFINR